MFLLPALMGRAPGPAAQRLRSPAAGGWRGARRARSHSDQRGPGAMAPGGVPPKKKTPRDPKPTHTSRSGPDSLPIIKGEMGCGDPLEGTPHSPSLSPIILPQFPCFYPKPSVPQPAASCTFGIFPFALNNPQPLTLPYLHPRPLLFLSFLSPCRDPPGATHPRTDGRVQRDGWTDRTGWSLRWEHSGGATRGTGSGRARRGQIRLMSFLLETSRQAKGARTTRPRGTEKPAAAPPRFEHPAVLSAPRLVTRSVTAWRATWGHCWVPHGDTAGCQLGDRGRGSSWSCTRSTPRPEDAAPLAAPKLGNFCSPELLRAACPRRRPAAAGSQPGSDKKGSFWSRAGSGTEEAASKFPLVLLGVN